MESRNEIPIDKGSLRKVTTAFKNTFSTEFEEPLASILEQHKEGLRPLTGYYISAKKGKNQLSKKIAKDVISKFLEVFAVDFIKETINLPELHGTLDTVSESFETINDHVKIKRKQKPKFNFDRRFLGKQYHVKFLIKKALVKKPIEEKIIFGTSFSGGFYDMQILNTLLHNRNLNLGELGGDFLISVDKLPFIKQEINQRMYDNYKSIRLSDVTIPIPKLVMNAT